MVEYTHKFICKDWASAFYLNENNPNTIYSENGYPYHSELSWLDYYEGQKGILIELIKVCLENK